LLLHFCSLCLSYLISNSPLSLYLLYISLILFLFLVSVSYPLSLSLLPLHSLLLSPHRLSFTNHVFSLLGFTLSSFLSLPLPLNSFTLSNFIHLFSVTVSVSVSVSVSVPVPVSSFFLLSISTCVPCVSCLSLNLFLLPSLRFSFSLCLSPPFVISNFLFLTHLYLHLNLSNITINMYSIYT